jgi:hypothetical protein
VVLIDNLSGAPLNGVIDAALRLAAGYTPAPPAPIPARRAATAAERAALVGRYAMGGRVLTITDENGELRGTQGGGGSVPVLMVGTDGIVLTPPGGAPMSFATVPGPDGRVRFVFSGGRALARQER